MLIGLAALFVSLGGAGMAATGGNFILGKPNSADATSSLTANIPGADALRIATWTRRLDQAASGSTSRAATLQSGSTRARAGRRT